MSEHIYEARVTKTTSTAAAHVATIVPGTLGAGIRMPEIREIGIYNKDGANAAEIGLGIPAVAGTTSSGAVTVQALNQLDPAGHTTVVPVWSGTQPTAPSNFYRGAQVQAIAGAGTIWVWGDGEFRLWSGATIPQVVIWQFSVLAVTYDLYVKVAELSVSRSVVRPASVVVPAGGTAPAYVPPALQVTTTSLPSVAESTSYSATLTAAGGTAPYTWSISVGSLPGWASLASSTGVISGTSPGSTGSTTFTAEVTDSASGTATQGLTLTVTSTALSYVTGLAASTSTQAGYFTDQYSNPRLWVATETWGLIVNAGAWTAGGSPANWQAEMTNFLSARAAQGVTVVMTDPIWSESANTKSSGGNTWDGVTPLAGGSTNPSSAALNSAFWTRVDYLVSQAAAYGITIGLVLFNTNDAGLGKTWTSTQRQAWGSLIGARYASTPNIIWMLGNDAWPSGDDTTWDSILAGLSAAGDSHLTAAWYEAEYTSRHETDNGTLAAWGAAHSACNFCYSYNAGYWIIEYAYGEVANEGASTLLAPVLGDGYFSQAGTSYSSTYDRALRQENWWVLASGGRGILFESEAVYPWGASSCVALVASEWYPSVNLPNIVTYFTGLSGWQLLLPDLSSAFVTAGRGTRVSGYTAGGGGGQYEPAFTNSYVAASVTPDGSLAVCYLPGHTTVTATTSMLASGWAAYWVDPVTCATSSAGAGPTFNSTAKGANSRGDPDWALVFHS